jgi:hypothetical protein
MSGLPIPGYSRIRLGCEKIVVVSGLPAGMSRAKFDTPP